MPASAPARSPAFRILAGFACAAATVGLAGQALLTVQARLAAGESVAAGLWRLAGYFTIWSNLGVAVVAAAITFVPESALAGARARTALLPSILVAGVAYTALLRPLIDAPQLAQAAVASLLHDVSPFAFLAAALAAPRQRLAFSDAALPLALPAAFLTVSLVRGASTGWFPYWFLDPSDVGALGYARNAAILALAFAGLGLAAVLLSRRPA